MGEVFSSHSNAQSKQHEMANALGVLGDRNASEEEKRDAFDALQTKFGIAPNISKTKEYAAELKRVFGLRFEKWKVDEEEMEKFDKMELADKIRGLIFGQALGDSVGLATEFLNREQVNEYYPADFEFSPGCRVKPDTHRFMFPNGDWTDDTDQFLLLLQVLLENGGEIVDTKFASKLLKWSQKGFEELGDQGGAGLGRTTKTVLGQENFPTDPIHAARHVWERAGKKAAPNGAVMRTAITGVPTFWDKDAVTRNTLTGCRVTHADPRCEASALVVAHMVSELLLGTNDQEKAVDMASTVLQSEQQKEEFQRFMTVETIQELQLDEARSIGFTLKCAGCAMWAIKQEKDNDFKTIIQTITRQGGDADTNAAPAGALLGAKLGFRNLPQDWINELAYPEWLEAWTQKILYMLDLPIKLSE